MSGLRRAGTARVHTGSKPLLEGTSVDARRCDVEAPPCTKTGPDMHVVGIGPAPSKGLNVFEGNECFCYATIS
ncbi:MAG: hypothetical protein GKR94_32485 [Gammaproteobacteria bacterium]|nr:hypothetical protein [Gammaproteobacteria bacterium]